MEWISVEDELPPENNRGIWDSVNYLVLLNNNFGHRVTLWINSRWAEYPQGGTKVTHWMPLPEPPK